MNKRRNPNKLFLRELGLRYFLILSFFTLALTMGMGCITGAKACDGDPTLDANNNCLPYNNKTGTVGPSFGNAIQVDCVKNTEVFEINNFSDLYKVSHCSNVNNGDYVYREQWLTGTYIISSNIDASDTCKNSRDPSFRNWIPIGSSNSILDQRFRGSFEGKCVGLGSTCTPAIISNLCINTNLEAGFIGRAKGVRIKNIILKGAKVSGKSYVGGFIGKVVEGNVFPTSLERVGFESGAVLGSGDYVGGLIGGIEEGGNISESYVRLSNIGGGVNVGGLVGKIDGTKISNVYVNDVSMAGQNHIGGLVGSIEDTSLPSKVSNFYAVFSNVNFDNEILSGGFVGFLNSNLAELSRGYVVANGVNFGLIGACNSTNNLRNSNLLALYYNRGETENIAMSGRKCSVDAEQKYNVYPLSTDFLQDYLFEQLYLDSSGRENKENVYSLQFNPEIWGNMGQKSVYPCLKNIEDKLSCGSNLNPTPPNINATNLKYWSVSGSEASNLSWPTLPCTGTCVTDFDAENIGLSWFGGSHVEIDPSLFYKLDIFHTGIGSSVSSSYPPIYTKEGEIQKSLPVAGLEGGTYQIQLSSCYTLASGYSCSPPVSFYPSLKISGYGNPGAIITGEKLLGWSSIQNDPVYYPLNWGTAFYSNGNISIKWNSLNASYYQVGIIFWSTNQPVNASFLQPNISNVVQNCIFEYNTADSTWKRIQRISTLDWRESSTCSLLSVIGGASGVRTLNLSLKGGMSFSIMVRATNYGNWYYASFQGDAKSRVVAVPLESNKDNPFATSSFLGNVQNGNYDLVWTKNHLRNDLGHPLQFEIYESGNFIGRTGNDSSSYSILSGVPGVYKYEVRPCSLASSFCGYLTKFSWETIARVGEVRPWLEARVSQASWKTFASLNSRLHIGQGGRTYYIKWNGVPQANRYEVLEVNSSPVVSSSRITSSWSTIYKINSCSSGVCWLSLESGRPIYSANALAVSYQVRSCRTNTCEAWDRVTKETLNFIPLSAPSELTTSAEWAPSSTDLIFETLDRTITVSGIHDSSQEGIESYELGVFSGSHWSEEPLFTNENTSFLDVPLIWTPSLLPGLPYYFRGRSCVTYSNWDGNKNCSAWSPRSEATYKIALPSITDLKISTIGGIEGLVSEAMMGETYSLSWSKQEGISKYLVTESHKQNQSKTWLIWLSSNSYYSKLIKINDIPYNGISSYYTTNTYENSLYPHLQVLNVNPSSARLRVNLSHLGDSSYIYSVKACPPHYGDLGDNSICQNSEETSVSIDINLPVITGLRVTGEGVLYDANGIVSTTGVETLRGALYSSYSGVFNLTWASPSNFQSDYGYKYKINVDNDPSCPLGDETFFSSANVYPVDLTGGACGKPNSLRRYTVYLCTFVGCSKTPSASIALTILPVGVASGLKISSSPSTYDINGIGEVYTDSESATLPLEWEPTAGFSAYRLYWSSASSTDFIEKDAVIHYGILKWQSLFAGPGTSISIHGSPINAYAYSLSGCVLSNCGDSIPLLPWDIAYKLKLYNLNASAKNLRVGAYSSTGPWTSLSHNTTYSGTYSLYWNLIRGARYYRIERCYSIDNTCSHWTTLDAINASSLVKSGNDVVYPILYVPNSIGSQDGNYFYKVRACARTNVGNGVGKCFTPTNEIKVFVKYISSNPNNLSDPNNANNGLSLSSPIYIYNYSQLRNIAKKAPISLSLNYRLAQNIEDGALSCVDDVSLTSSDLSQYWISWNTLRSTLTWASNVTKGLCTASGFPPIGDETQPFTGNFDGAGYVIKNLNIWSSRKHVGLFGYIKGGRVQNLGMVNEYVSSQGNASHIGGLVGWLSNSSIERSFASGDKIISPNYTGGLVGAMAGNSTIRSSYVAFRTLIGWKTAGGIVGEVYSGDISGTIAVAYLKGLSSNSGGGVVGSLLYPNQFTVATGNNYYWGGPNVSSGGCGNSNSFCIKKGSVDMRGLLSLVQADTKYSLFNFSWSVGTKWMFGGERYLLPYVVPIPPSSAPTSTSTDVTSQDILVWSKVMCSPKPVGECGERDGVSNAIFPGETVSREGYVVGKADGTIDRDANGNVVAGNSNYRVPIVRVDLANGTKAAGIVQSCTSSYTCDENLILTATTPNVKKSCFASSSRKYVTSDLSNNPLSPKTPYTLPSQVYSYHVNSCDSSYIYVFPDNDKTVRSSGELGQFHVPWSTISQTPYWRQNDSNCIETFKCRYIAKKSVYVSAYQGNYYGNYQTVKYWKCDDNCTRIIPCYCSGISENTVDRYDGETFTIPSSGSRPTACGQSYNTGTASFTCDNGVIKNFSSASCRITKTDDCPDNSCPQLFVKESTDSKLIYQENIISNHILPISKGTGYDKITTKLTPQSELIIKEMELEDYFDHTFIDSLTLLQAISTRAKDEIYRTQDGKFVGLDINSAQKVKLQQLPNRGYFKVEEARVSGKFIKIQGSANIENLSKLRKKNWGVFKFHEDYEKYNQALTAEEFRLARRIVELNVLVFRNHKWEPLQLGTSHLMFYQNSVKVISLPEGTEKIRLLYLKDILDLKEVSIFKEGNLNINIKRLSAKDDRIAKVDNLNIEIMRGKPLIIKASDFISKGNSSASYFLETNGFYIPYTKEKIEKTDTRNIFLKAWHKLEVEIMIKVQKYYIRKDDIFDAYNSFIFLTKIF